LQKITSDPSEKVQNGALVKTNKGLFYISASMGEIIFENQKIMTVSAESPLVKAMFGKKMEIALPSIISIRILKISGKSIYNNMKFKNLLLFAFLLGSLSMHRLGPQFPQEHMIWKR
jgi:hypothetical protein